MLFFKRILSVGRKRKDNDRRGASRYDLNARFPVKSILNIMGRDDHGQLLKAKGGAGMDWRGKLINLSTTGARIQLPTTALALRDDPCQLKIDIQGYRLVIPGKIANVIERPDHIMFGITFDLGAAAINAAYGQLLDLVALGSSLKLTQPRKSDASGYLLEQYEGDGSLLRVWRSLESEEVSAFEFVLRDSMVRGLAAQAGVECLNGTDVATALAAKGPQAEEIHRLYQWVVCNLDPAIPDDVRNFLVAHAA